MIYDYCILGAGISGALIAEKIESFGKSFCLIDKGRSSGCRLSCKRMGSIYFNHGLQSFDCNLDNRKWIKDLINEKSLSELAPYKILVPANQVVKKILRQILIHTNEEIVKITYQNSLFSIQSKSDAEWSAKKVICTFPAPQALKVFGNHLTAQQSTLLESVQYTKRLICFTDTKIAQDLNSDYKINTSADFSMISFSEKISEKYFEQSDVEIILNLKKNYSNLFINTEMEQLTIKKWRYANCNHPLLQKHIVDKNNHLFLIGDYFGTPTDTSLERTISSAESIFNLLEHR